MSERPNLSPIRFSASLARPHLMNGTTLWLVSDGRRQTWSKFFPYAVGPAKLNCRAQEGVGCVALLKHEQIAFLLWNYHVTSSILYWSQIVILLFQVIAILQCQSLAGRCISILQPLILQGVLTSFHLWRMLFMVISQVYKQMIFGKWEGHEGYKLWKLCWRHIKKPHE